MSTEGLDPLRYPIGRFVRGTKALDSARRQNCIAELERFPQRLVKALEVFDGERLDVTYRPGGWTVRQLVHHLADSHGQALHRFKLALTEDRPHIKPYLEALWAEQADARTMAVEPSLGIISGTHARWVVLLRAMSDADFDRSYYHPEQQRDIDLAEALELYVWHGAHHLAHIQGLRDRSGW